MNRSTSLYDSARLAAGYAYSRPPVHPHVIRLVAEQLYIAKPLGSALDVGCGAGRSTDALGELAGFVVGLDPVPAMLAYSHAVAPRAAFAVGQAEELPFTSDTFDLITAAGSLNYVDLPRFLPEAARVLAPTGTLIIYDFSAGRRFRSSDALDEWFASFERRYPFPPDYELDVRTLAYERTGLRLSSYQEFEVALSFTAGSYGEYVLSEANVELAITQGVPEDMIREWCRSSIEEVFGDTPQDVLFSGYIAYVGRG